ncbi:MAG: amidohydrolase family protein [Kiritimatiellaeota bacterium]|nr:amidohydrolase family protein [Kiritimatiellota bacterium]
MKAQAKLRLCVGWLAADFFMSAVVAQEQSRTGPDSGPPPTDQELGMNLAVLNKVRAEPQAKPFILARRKEVLARRGFTDADARVAELGKIFDEARALSAADFEKNQQQLAQRVMALMQPAGTGALAAKPAKAIPFIDVHAHLVGAGMMSPQGMSPTAKAAIELMDKTHTQMMIVMPVPGNGNPVPSPRDPTYERKLAEAVRKYPTRLAFLAGGLSFETIPNKPVTDEIRRKFETRAEEILRSGARGFGEIALLHTPAYEAVPGDHPLMLLLADIAARHDVVLDIHMEVVTDEVLIPANKLSEYEATGDAGWLACHKPKTLTPNIPAFERLLGHNPKTKIILEHLGSDFNNQWILALSRRLLEKHPNLYLSLRLLPRPRFSENNPLASGGEIKPDWLKLFQDFPTRFLLGLDRFIAPSDAKGDGGGLQLAKSACTPEFALPTQTFLNALPPDLARKIACENASALFKLKN